MSIDLRLLRHARALAEHGSFRRAAESLKIAQPSLSRGIKDLEAHAGQALFIRNRSGHDLTDFGRVFLQHAIAVLERVDDLDREVEMAKGMASGEVAIGFGPYPAAILAPICAARFAEKHPGMRLRIEMNDPAKVLRALRARTVDLAVAEQSLFAAADDLEWVARLEPIPGYVVVRRNHPLAGKSAVTLAEVLDYPFAQVFMLPPRVLKPILESRRASPDSPMKRASPFPAIECSNTQLALQIVANSNAFTFASLGMVHSELELGQLVPLLQAPWLRAEWGLVRLRNRAIPSAVLGFAEELRQAHAEALRNEAQLAGRWSGLPRAAVSQVKPEPERQP